MARSSGFEPIPGKCWFCLGTRTHRVRGKREPDNTDIVTETGAGLPFMAHLRCLKEHQEDGHPCDDPPGDCIGPDHANLLTGGNNGS